MPLLYNIRKETQTPDFAFVQNHKRSGEIPLGKLGEKNKMQKMRKNLLTIGIKSSIMAKLSESGQGLREKIEKR